MDDECKHPYSNYGDHVASVLRYLQEISYGKAYYNIKLVSQEKIAFGHDVLFFLHANTSYFVIIYFKFLF